MISPRWKKVVRDISQNKTRSLLVVSSIAIGVFAIGAVLTSSVVLGREMDRHWKKAAPNHARISLSGIGEDWVKAVRAMPGIADAEARSSTYAYVVMPDGSRKPIEITAIAHFEDIRIDRIDLASHPEQTGQFESAGPALRQLALEQNSFGFLGVQLGDDIKIEMPNQKVYKLRVAQSAHDPRQMGGLFMFSASAYVAPNTWAGLGMPNSFNTLLIRTAAPTNLPNVQASVARIRTRAQRAGLTGFDAQLPDELDSHPAHRTLQGILFLMGFMGIIALCLSGFLIVNTMSAILAQQTRQVGMMKAIGAQPRHLVRMYSAHAFIYGVLAASLAVPLGIWGAHVFVNAISRNLLGLSVESYDPHIGVILIQIAMSLGVPLLSAILPIRSGANKTVQAALSDYGVDIVTKTRSHQINWLKAPVSIFSRPIRMSLRNTFRRKKRLGLTLSVLAIGGALFIGVLCLRQSLVHTLDVALDYWRYDIGVYLSHDYPRERLEQEALRVPGVVHAESWGFSSANIVRQDRSTGPDLLITAPPANTQMLSPIVLQGRWLIEEDRDTLVVNTEIIRIYPELQLGDKVTLQLKDANSTLKATFRIVGVVQGVLTGPIVYINRQAFAKASHSNNRYASIVLQTNQHDAITQVALAKEVEDHFRRSGLSVGSAQPTAQLRAAILMQFDMLTYVLLAMATLLALIGGLGLAGTMSINVIERTREMGVMRAIGAQSGIIRKMIVVEGIVVGLLSAVIATILSIPISYGLIQLLAALLQFQIYFTFSIVGLLIWLVLVVGVAAVSSVLPAIWAARTTTREALSYV